MNRRDLLKGLAALPFASMLVGKPANATTPPPELNVVPNESTVLTGLSPEKMAEMLSANLDAYIKGHYIQPWDPEEVQTHHRVCKVFCERLLGPDLSLPYFQHQPDHDSDALRFVSFGVATTPVAVLRTHGLLQVKPVLARKIRSSYGPRMFEDIHACSLSVPGVMEREIAGIGGGEAALEVHAEVRHDLRGGKKVHTYALYLPPFYPPGDPEMMKTFSVCRRPMIRYAKFC
jgi:hypothetical protein